jgi:hypothetical protein
MAKVETNLDPRFWEKMCEPPEGSDSTGPPPGLVGEEVTTRGTYVHISLPDTKANRKAVERLREALTGQQQVVLEVITGPE